MRGGLSAATKDDNSVVFTRKQQTEFDSLREHVENYVAGRSAPASIPPLDPADQIRQLAALRDEGVLTAEEFEAKKKQLLGL